MDIRLHVEENRTSVTWTLELLLDIDLIVICSNSLDFKVLVSFSFILSFLSILMMSS